MEIIKVDYLNLDVFYKAICNISKIGNNYEDLLSNVVITFHIKNISKSEYLFLKLMTPKVYRMKEFEYKGNSDTFNSFPELGDTILGKKINEYIKKYEDKSYIYKDLLLPLGLLTTDVIASFTGASLISIFTLSPRSTIVTLTSGDCLDNSSGRLIPDYDINNLSDDDKDMFEAKLMNHFIEIFYKQILMNVKSFNDIDRFIQTNYFESSEISFESPLIVNIINPYILTKNVDNDFDNKIKNIPEISKDFIIKNTSVIFNCLLPFSAFISLYDFVPSNKIIAKNPFIIPIGASAYENDNLSIFISKEEAEFKQDTYALNNNIKSIIDETYRSNPSLALKTYLLPFGYESISFHINVDMEDLDTWVVPMTKKLSKSTIVTDKILYNFSLKILNDSISIYKKFFKK